MLSPAPAFHSEALLPDPPIVAGTPRHSLRPVRYPVSPSSIDSLLAPPWWLFQYSPHSTFFFPGTLPVGSFRRKWPFESFAVALDWLLFPRSVGLGGFYPATRPPWVHTVDAASQPDDLVLLDLT